ncbi:hypothetical protein SUDANB121_00342 [Nocardiopsis dassonvillei]
MPGPSAKRTRRGRRWRAPAGAAARARLSRRETPILVRVGFAREALPFSPYRSRVRGSGFSSRENGDGPWASLPDVVPRRSRPRPALRARLGTWTTPAPRRCPAA